MPLNPEIIARLLILALNAELRTKTGILDSIQIIGRSPSITRLKARISHFSADTEPLVIIGETGSGKTLLAKAIHARSPRRSLKLNSVNFSILSEREQRVALLGAGPPDLTIRHRAVPLRAPPINNCATNSMLFSCCLRQS